MTNSARKGGKTSSRFKWQWRSESPLTAPMVDDVPPEIELSAYRRLPSSGSESPSGLLNDEGPKAEPIADLDLFFERMYNYYCEKGLTCIITKWIFEILSVIFVECFIWFFLLVVDWNALWNAKCGIDAFESGSKPCDLAKKAIKPHPLVPFTLTKVIIVGSMVIVTIYGLFNFLKFIVQFKNTLKIRHFYYNSLNVTDREIQTTPWPVILEKAVQLQHSQQLCVVKDLSAHDVVMRIMRKENYLIGMLNKGVLAFPMSRWIPGAGPAVKSRKNGRKNHLILTKTLEWTLNWCILQSMFDNKFCVQRDFVTNPSLLKKRLMIIGIGMLLISPCLVIFMLVYLFLRHAEQFYHHPSIVYSRRWSNLSEWIFREFNEVDHLFKHRINNSVEHTSNYLKQFPSPRINIIAKFISFVSGGFVAILIIIGFIDESLLEGHILGRNLLWYAAVFGAMTAISRAAMADELQVLDPEGAMSLVVQHTHYMPKRWRGKEHSALVRAEVETLFQYTGMMLLEEMVSIFLTPILLIFVIPKCADDILHFISDFTVYIDGVGHVCSLSVFDFESHGNRKYGSPCDAAKDRRSTQGKMEKSFLSFQSAYPTWEPSAHGQKFLSTLRNFRQSQAHQETDQNYLLTRTWQFAPHLRGQGDAMHRFTLQKGLCHNGDVPKTGHHLGPFLLSNPDQRTYLLDCYYVSKPVDMGEDLKDSPPSPNKIAFDADQGSFSAHNELRTEINDKDESWGPLSERQQSYLDASISSPLFRNNVHQHQDPEHHTVTPWWARAIPQSSGLQTSFLEPPSFGHHNYGHHSDDINDGTSEQQDSTNGSTNWSNLHNLSKTTCMDESDSAEPLNLPFVDDYAGPPKNLTIRIIPRSNDPVQ
ncbi:autophagy-related protein 9 isoform X2 [Elaeis guineensis]|uniref:autophagy-related protein 9 isoform X2 n=1 Tax=Elaeis guineensis var. tenera TaxID=51953 RepID=UPI00057B761A